MRQPPLEPRVLQSVFMLLLVAQLAFLGIVLVFLRENNEFIFDALNLYTWAIPLGIVGLDYVAWHVFNQKISSIREEQDMLERVHILQGAYIVQWVMVQAGTFLLLTFSLLEMNDYYIALSLAQILYYSTLRPRLFNFSEDV